MDDDGNGYLIRTIIISKMIAKKHDWYTLVMKLDHWHVFLFSVLYDKCFQRSNLESTHKRITILQVAISLSTW